MPPQFSNSDIVLENLSKIHSPFFLLDAQNQQNPICYASQELSLLTGYNPTELVGKPWRCLPGPQTPQYKIREIMDAMRELRECRVCLPNCKKSGEIFWSQWLVCPLCDHDGNLVHFLGVEQDVTSYLGLDESFAGTDSESSNSDSFSGSGAQHQNVEVVIQQERRTSMDIARALNEVQPEATDLRRGSSLGRRQTPYALTQVLQKLNSHPFLLLDPNREEMPVVHATSAFEEQAKYSREQLTSLHQLQHQLPGQEQSLQDLIHPWYEQNFPAPLNLVFLAARPSSDLYWCLLHLCPLRNADGKVAYLAAVTQDITDKSKDRAADCMEECSEAAAAGAPPCDQPGVLHRVVQQGVVGQLRVAVRGLKGNGDPLGS